MNELMKANANDLEQELQWFRRVLDTRFKLNFGQAADFDQIEDIAPHVFDGSTSNWAKILEQHKPNSVERLALVLALVPHLAPQVLDIFFIKNTQSGRSFAEFGGADNQTHKGFVPTGETLLFLAAGNNLAKRFAAMSLFHPDHFFSREKILSLEKSKPNDLPYSGVLTLSAPIIAALTHGENPIKGAQLGKK